MQKHIIIAFLSKAGHPRMRVFS